MEKREKRKFTIYKKAKLIMRISAMILVTFFGYLEFKDLSFNLFMTDDGANLIFKIALALYYSSWIFGLTVDMNAEEYTFDVLPNKNKLTNKSLIMIFGLITLFGLLCYATSFVFFIIVLDVLFVVNIISWKYIINFINPTFKENQEIVKHKFDIEYHNALQDYLTGEWQKYRFAYGALILIILNIIIFTNLNVLLASKLHSNPQFIIASGLLFYVLTFEIWVWVKRIERILSFTIYDKLDDRYILQPKLKSDID